MSRHISKQKSWSKH